MHEKDLMGIPAPPPALEPVMLEAEPEPLEIDLRRTAVIVIDMQNAFVSRGGFFDLIGQDISPAQKIIGHIKKVNSAARVKGCKVIYFAATYSSDLRESGGLTSPHWYKGGKISAYLEHPEWRDKLLLRGTWGADIVEELKPQEIDILIEKPRYSAFFRTSLDTILKTYNIKYLVFVGVATNVCVEASIRDAFLFDYFPILISDAVIPGGPPFVQEATEFNVKQCYGWVTTSEDIVRAMGN